MANLENREPAYSCSRIIYGGSCPNGELPDEMERTADNQCGSCNPGYFMEEGACEPWGGECWHGTLAEQEARTMHDQCAACDAGHYCSGAHAAPCPNGTMCPRAGLYNFTLCSPGTFQPRAGQTSCMPCPVGYLCADSGMTRPTLCPAGSVCDRTWLRSPSLPCPAGHYCLAGTKTARTHAFLNMSTELGVWSTEAVRVEGRARALGLNGYPSAGEIGRASCRERV